MRGRRNILVTLGFAMSVSLILDEGTSALDEETAWEIESELLEMRELTLLTITHHLNSPQKYDQVFTLSAK